MFDHLFLIILILLLSQSIIFNIAVNWKERCCFDFAEDYWILLHNEF